MKTHNHSAQKPLSLLSMSAALTALTLLVELAGGLWTNSVALLSDAGHVFMDLSALLFSLFALHLAQRPATDKRTFGLHRLEVFAAFLNGTLVTILAIWIFVEAFGRIKEQPPVRVEPMIAVAVWGLAINIFVAWKLRSFADTDINIRSAFLHVASDALASVSVVVGGVVIYCTGLLIVDPIVAMLVAAVILVNAVRLFRDSVEILLEGVPKHIQLPEVVRSIKEISGVADVEDTHVWNICSHLCSLSAHVVVSREKMAEQQRILDDINRILRQRFSIAHSTIQIHSSDWRHPPSA